MNMDINSIIGSIQLVLSFFQLKLDHYTKQTNVNDESNEDNFYNLGEAIRLLEYALSETAAVVGSRVDKGANPRLSSLWGVASEKLKSIQDNAEFTDIAFEKHLYWRNPDSYSKRSDFQLYRISLENVLDQLRDLRQAYDKQNKKKSRIH